MTPPHGTLFDKVSEDIQDRGIKLWWRLDNQIAMQLILQNSLQIECEGVCLYVRSDQASLRAFGGCLGVERR